MLTSKIRAFLRRPPVSLEEAPGKVLPRCRHGVPRHKAPVTAKYKLAIMQLIPSNVEIFATVPTLIKIPQLPVSNMHADNAINVNKKGLGAGHMTD